MIDRTFWRFVAVGLANTIVGLAVIFAFRSVVNDYFANLMGYVLVVPLSFLTHRRLSFRDAGSRWRAFSRYVPTVTIGYSVNLSVLTYGLLVDANPYLTQTVAILFYVAVTYLLSRYFVFRSRNEPPTHFA